MNTAALDSLKSAGPGLDTISKYRRIAIAVGHDAALFNSKTAMSLLRYRGEHCLAVIDPAHCGKTTQELYGIGGATPVVASLSDVDSPDALFIGISPPGGQMPEDLGLVISEGVQRGLDVVSGLHEFLVENEAFCQEAERSGSLLIDVRRNQHRKTAHCADFRPGCLRIHAVGQDCSVGKMVTMLELERGLQKRQADAKFLATGQTGIMIVGNGVPVDCVVSDFVNGAVEELVLQNEQHEILLIEGQGSITHPAFSAVTLGLLHGCAPQGLVFCYEAARPHVKGLPHVPLKALEHYRELYEQLASVRYPAEFVGVAMNGRNISAAQAEMERQQVQELLGLPVCDVFRDGPDVLVDAVLGLKESLSA